MADRIKLATNMVLKGTAGTTYYQVITDAVDVSVYDSVDFQISGSGDSVNGFVVDILTSMQNTADDIAAGANSPSWYTLGAVTLAFTAGVPGFKSLSVPVSSTNAPMLRWLRYQIHLNAGTSYAAFSIEGLARRGLRVG